MAEISPKLIKELTNNINNIKRKVDSIDGKVNSMDEYISDRSTEFPEFDINSLRDSIINGINKSGIKEEEFPVDEVVERISNKFISSAKESIDGIFNDGSKKLISDILSSNPIPKNLELLDKSALEDILSNINPASFNINQISLDVEGIKGNSEEPRINSLVSEEGQNILSLEEPKEIIEEGEQDLSENFDFNSVSMDIMDSIKELLDTKSEKTETEPIEPIIIKEDREAISKEEFSPLDITSKETNITTEEEPIISEVGKESLNIENEYTEDIVSDLEDKILNKSKKETPEVQEVSIISNTAPESIDQIKEVNVDALTGIETPIANEILKKQNAIEEKVDFIPPQIKGAKENGDIINNVNEVLNEFIENKETNTDYILEKAEKEKIKALDDLNEVTVKNELPKLKEIIDKSKEGEELITGNLELSNRIKELIDAIKERESFDKESNKQMRIDSANDNKNNKKSKDKPVSNSKGEDKGSSKSNDYGPDTIKLLNEILLVLSGPLRISEDKPYRPNSRFN